MSTNSSSSPASTRSTTSGKLKSFVERHQGLGLLNGLNERVLQFELRLDGMDHTLLELA